MSRQLSLERAQVHVGSRLTLMTAVDPVIRRQIEQALEFDNPAKEQAKAEQVWGWDQLPDKIVLHDRDQHGRLTMPRGFAVQLRKGLAHYGIDVDWQDFRRDVPVPTGAMDPVVFGPERDYQELAVEKILTYQQGMWQAPPGAGKTVGVLEAIRRTGQKALVIVNQANIARQWQHRCYQHINYSPGLVGDGEYDISWAITIGMQQTIWRRFDELYEEGFFSAFGFVCLDECHHLPADTFTRVLQSFDARYRIGVSATPDLQGVLPIMEATLGDVFHVTPKQILIDRGILVKPSVLVHPTSFDAGFWPTHNPFTVFTCERGHVTRKPKDGVCVKMVQVEDSEDMRECCGAIVSSRTTCDFEQSGCSRNGKVHRNNYTDAVASLIEDDDRNALIARWVAKDFLEGHGVVVQSDRLEHLKELKRRVTAIVGEDHALFMYTGEQDTTERGAIEEWADNDPCVLFSTIAKEALDIPRLDRMHLAYPGRNTELLKQRIGRIERAHPHKTDAVVHDYFDDTFGLKGQFSERRREVYARGGLEVTFAETE